MVGKKEREEEKNEVENLARVIHSDSTLDNPEAEEVRRTIKNDGLQQFIEQEVVHSRKCLTPSSEAGRDIRIEPNLNSRLLNLDIGKWYSPSVETSRDGGSTQRTSQHLDQAIRGALRWVVRR